MNIYEHRRTHMNMGASVLGLVVYSRMTFSFPFCLCLQMLDSELELSDSHGAFDGESTFKNSSSELRSTQLEDSNSDILEGA